ncbi:hypothetical protein ABZY06_33960 [Streptomyces sp. NPDC006540]|uniref:hypothetical protein n=1 Tax=Streptomyces sp. NPDC006540 TaxID=3155353 RepID=UPI0033A240F3
MALAPLATTTELAAWMQVDASALPAGASAVLTMVSAIVRREARQRFTLGTTTVKLYPRDGYVTPPQRPVRSVVSVLDADGAPVEYELRRDRLYLARLCTAVSVTYTHGYEETPGDVLAVVLSAAQRVLGNPRDLRQETVGSQSVTYAAETIGASLSQADKDMLRTYRRGAAMVAMG